MNSGPLLLRLRRPHMTRWHDMSISVNPCSDLRLRLYRARVRSTTIGARSNITRDPSTQTSYHDKTITMRQGGQPVHPSNHRGRQWYLGSTHTAPIIYRPVFGTTSTSFSRRTHHSLPTLCSRSVETVRHDERNGKSSSQIRITSTQCHHFSSMPPPNPTKEKVSGTKGKDVPVGLEETNHNHNSTTTSIVDRLPLSVQPYMRLARLDKPIGTMLLLWPCYWSTAIAADPGHWPDPKLLGLFTIGTHNNMLIRQIANSTHATQMQMQYNATSLTFHELNLSSSKMCLFFSSHLFLLCFFL
mmetsp:Transcript_21400/g.38674  ORF Transcript_21400/g.38674 Transcript_21400/m.38674 type:complete len:300 (+) Transcript_21400:228-1127(+)